jgi:Flp pilus assembly protein TadG
MQNKRLRPAREKQPVAAASSPCGRLIRKFYRGRRGGLSVEFDVLASLFGLLVFGIVDFGHALFMTISSTTDMQVEQGEMPACP